MDVIEQTPVDTITITDEAARVIKDLLVQKNVPDYGLRLFVQGGGCSGLQYGMALDPEANQYDNVIEYDGIKVFVDPNSMMYLSNATIDYEDSIMGGGFKIDNPNALASCGCGHSFKTGDSQGAANAAGGCSC